MLCIMRVFSSLLHFRLWFLKVYIFTATTQSVNRSHSQRTCRTAGMWAEGWAALWNKPCTASWHSGCPAGTHPCSGQDSHRSQTLLWLEKTDARLTVYINRTNKSDQKKKKRWRVSSTNAVPQFLYVGGNSRQPVDSIHDSMRLDKLTAASQDLGNFEEQWEINKGIRMLRKRQQNNLFSTMCFILFSYIVSKFLLGIVYDTWNLWFFKTESCKRRLLRAMPKIRETMRMRQQQAD